MNQDSTAEPSKLPTGYHPWGAILLDLRAWWEENDRKRVAMREERSKK